VAENTTQHLFIKNFVPYFDSSDDTNNLEDIYSSSIAGYSSFAKQHIVKNSA